MLIGDVPLKWRQYARLRVLQDAGLGVQHLEDPIPRRERLLIDAVQPREALERPDERQDGPQEHHEGAQRQLLREDRPAAEPEHDRPAADADDLRRWGKQIHALLDAARDAIKPLVVRRKLLARRALRQERLNHLYAGHGLEDGRAQVPHRHLGLLRKLLEHLADVDNGPGNQRHHQEDDEGELRMDGQGNAQIYRDLKTLVEEVVHALGHAVLNDARVIENPGHLVAGGSLLVVVHGEAHEPVEDRLAQVAQDELRSVVDVERLEEFEEALEQIDDRNRSE